MYRTYYFDIEDEDINLQDELNRICREGYELVGILPQTTRTNPCFIFKRID